MSITGSTATHQAVNWVLGDEKGRIWCANGKATRKRDCCKSSRFKMESIEKLAAFWWSENESPRMTGVNAIKHWSNEGRVCVCRRHKTKTGGK